MPRKERHMRKLVTTLFLAGLAPALWAQVNDAPPAYVAPTEKVQRNAPPAPDLKKVGTRLKGAERATYEASRLEPTAEDMARARAERAKRTDSGKVTKYRSEYGTVIEETHDQDNRITEVCVTPGSTSIPYTMKNTSERPVDNRPGADPRSTLDTPKFIEFSW